MTDEYKCQHTPIGIKVNKHYSVSIRQNQVQGEPFGFNLRCDGEVELIGDYKPDDNTMLLLKTMSEALSLPESPYMDLRALMRGVNEPNQSPQPPTKENS